MKVTVVVFLLLAMLLVMSSSHKVSHDFLLNPYSYGYGYPRTTVVRRVIYPSVYPTSTIYPVSTVYPTVYRRPLLSASLYHNEDTD